jgi:hypothetical protein
MVQSVAKIGPRTCSFASSPGDTSCTAELIQKQSPSSSRYSCSEPKHGVSRRVATERPPSPDEAGPSHKRCNVEGKMFFSLTDGIIGMYTDKRHEWFEKLRADGVAIQGMVCDALNEVVAAYYRGEFHEAVTDDRR